MKQITDLQEIVGKTIMTVSEDWNELWMVFSDESFICLETEYEMSEIHVNTDEINATNQKLVELGLVTVEEQREAVEEERRKSLEKYQKEQQDLVLRKEARDR